LVLVESDDDLFESDDDFFESPSVDFFVSPLDEDSFVSDALEDEPSFGSLLGSALPSLEDVSESWAGVGRLSLR